MKSLIFLAVALGLVAAATAQTEYDQDQAYINCTIKRRVRPPEISKEDSEFCLKEAGVPNPGDDEFRDKGKTWRNCLITNAARLDDRVSPAREISQAIVGLCVNEWRAYASATWMYPSAKRDYVNGVLKYAVGEGVQAVLITRRVRRDLGQE